MAKALARTKLPVVDVLGVVANTPFPLVHVDNQAIGYMAANHLLDRGLRHFAFLGIEEENWSLARETAFMHQIANSGHAVQVRREPRHIADDLSWETHQQQLSDWISSLPTPLGVMVCSDQRGTAFLDACRRSGVRVPDEVCVVGVDNDEPLCSVCNPPLSSVWPNHSMVGYEAAALLERLISGDKQAPSRLMTQPKKVITRQSTDTLAVADLTVAKALRIIRDRACERMRIDEIAQIVGVSRSVLQRKFRSNLGRSINDELVQQRIKTARQLLLETQLPLIDVAERSGFQHQEYLGWIFRKHLGTSPALFRKQGQI
jgi:LacI family transcriptional regulator